MKTFMEKLRKALSTPNVNSRYRYRWGTHYKIGYGRCYCIQRENFLGNWVTVYETDSKEEWNAACIHINQRVTPIIKNNI